MFGTKLPLVDENVAQYEVYMRFEANEDAAQQKKRLEDRLNALTALAKTLTNGFLWHRHAFRLHVQPCPTFPNPLDAHYYLTGVTSVGDAIQDEWVLVYLLAEFTRQFDDLIVRIWDNDGEFLLIECADVLPSWLSPENSEHRVFLKHGKLHVLPLSSPDDENEVLSLDDAMEQWWKLAEDVTLASAALQQMLQGKIANVPAYMVENKHQLTVWLPQKAAQVIRQHPEVVSVAVESFYYREPTHATMICNRMTHFKPVDMTTQRVVMTRCMYAQLKQQEFYPPKPFLQIEPFAQLMRPQANVDDALHRRADMGLKLVCGLELLMASDLRDQDNHLWSEKLTDWMAQLDPTVLDIIEPDDDDDSWLYIHPDGLEEILQRAAGSSHDVLEEPEAETIGGAEELSEIASMFDQFVKKASDVDGVDTHDSIQFDVDALMELLKRGPMDDYESEEEEEEVDDDRLMGDAMDEMEAELSETTLAQSFARMNCHDTPVKVEEPEEPEETTPLDLNFNLLSSLLESVASQDGMAGPVTNMLAEMGKSSLLCSRSIKRRKERRD